LLKLIFRAFDKDRSRSLSADEIKQIGQYTGNPKTDAEVKQAILKHTGKGDGQLTFAQATRLLTGATIPADADPYEGKLKSGSCLLL
jgi:Ca2+-binding EF-hand superfamily protein